MPPATSPLWTALLASLLAAHASADFQVDLYADSRAHQPDGDYTFIPGIVAQEDGVPTDAVVRLTSPNGHFFGAENLSGPSGTGGRVVASLSEITTEVNGAWRVTIDDAGELFQYDVDVQFAYPFTEHPRLVSDTIVDGTPLGPLAWRIEGGTAEYPGASTTFVARLFEEPSTTLVDSAFLPFPTTTWTPQADPGAADNFLVSLTLSGVAEDLTSLKVTGIRALTPGAPALSFGRLSVEYSSSLSASLAAPVPEPAAAAVLAGFALAGGLIRGGIPRARRTRA